jgi:hypothetical protein
MATRYAIVLAAAAMVLLGASPALAGAGRQMAAGGGALGPDLVTSVRTAGGNTIVVGTSTGALGGTFQADFKESFRDVIHADGSVNIAGTVSLEGQTPCGTGKWTQRLVVHVAPNGSFSGQTAAINAAAATIPLRTQYSFSGAANTFAYAGSYSCA